MFSGMRQKDIEYLNKLREKNNRQLPPINNTTPFSQTNNIDRIRPLSEPIFSTERNNPFNNTHSKNHPRESIKYIRPINTYPKCYHKSPMFKKKAITKKDLLVTRRKMKLPPDADSLSLIRDSHLNLNSIPEESDVIYDKCSLNDQNDLFANFKESLQIKDDSKIPVFNFNDLDENNIFKKNTKTLYDEINETIGKNKLIQELNNEPAEEPAEEPVEESTEESKSLGWGEWVYSFFSRN